MPRSGDIDTTYPAKLQDIGIQLLESFKGAKTHHRMKCLVCGNKWRATPIAKLQSNKKRGGNGCPECNLTEIMKERNAARANNIQKLKDRGLEILCDWDGRFVQGVAKQSIPVMVQVRNTSCGHIFTSSSKNLLTRNIECPECAKLYRTNLLNARAERVHNQWSQTATDWQKYKSEVTKLTRLVYNKHKDQINPNNFPKGRAGTPGAYHIDHIVPIRWCFKNNVPAKICADPSNLQMLGWRENVGSRDKLKEKIPVPSIFVDKYINKQ